jgi:hypothetical protein
MGLVACTLKPPQRPTQTTGTTPNTPTQATAIAQCPYPAAEAK